MIKSYREYKGWDVYYTAIDCLAWTARKDDGSKLRADTWEGIRKSIDEYDPE